MHVLATLLASLAFACPCIGRVLPTREDGSDQAIVQQLTEATRGLQQLRVQWENLPPVTSSSDPGMTTRGTYVQRDADLRASVQGCPLGDPALTSTVSRHPTGDEVANAHMETTRAIFEAKLAHQAWEIKCMEAAQKKSGMQQLNPQIGSALVSLAELKLRLFELDDAYEYLQRAAILGSPDQRLSLLNRYCAQLKAPRASDIMTGVDLSPGSRGEQLLQGIKKVFLDAGYYVSTILMAASATTMSHFIYLTRADDLESNLNRARVSQNLKDLVRIFLLHRVVPLSQIRSLFGPEALKMLLSLQVIQAVEGSSFRLVPPLQALAAVQDDPQNCGGLLAFSNIEFWPIEEDLVIATDFQETYSTEDLEPVMYISEDSLALVHAAPREPKVDRLLDVCTGSGVQGIVGLRYYANTCMFVDLNPRALKFTKFNLALNGYADRALGLYQGSGYDALPSDAGIFDAIVANPPFVPNPDNVASGAGAMFGNGGTTGEKVMAMLVSGAHRMLKPGGRLSTVSVAPNVEQFPSRIEGWYFSEASATGGFEGHIFRGTPKTADEYAPGGGSTVESVRYKRALKNLGIVTLSDVLTIIRVGGDGARVSIEGGPKYELWEDYSFLRTVVQKALSAEPSPLDTQPLVPEQPPSSPAGASSRPADVADVAESQAIVERRGILEQKLSDMLRYLQVASDVGYAISHNIRQSVQEKVRETQEWSQTHVPAQALDDKMVELDNFMDEVVSIIQLN